MTSHPASSGPYNALRGRAVGLLAVICAAFFLDALDTSMVNVAIPDIGQALALTSTLQWVVAGYVLGFGGFLLFGGRAADLLGRRNVFLIALAIFVLMSALGGIAWNGELLIATRFLKGIAAAFTAPAALSLVTTSFAEGEARNRALAFYTATGSAGFTFGLIFGGILTSWNWRAVFFMPAVVGLATLVAGIALVPQHRRTPGEERERLDIPGAATITITMSALVYALTTGPEAGWGTARTIASFAIAGIALLVFIAIERSVRHPLLPFSILASWPRVRAYIAAMAFVGGWAAAQYLATLYMQDTRGWSPLETAAAFWPCGILGLFIAPYISKLITRFSLMGTLAFGLALAVAAYVLLERLGVESGYWLALFPSFALIGIAFTFAFSSFSIAATAHIAEHEQGLASGVLQSAIQFGIAMLLAITTAIYQGHLPANADANAQLDAYRAGWWVPLIAAGIALVLALAGMCRPRPPASVEELASQEEINQSSRKESHV